MHAADPREASEANYINTQRGHAEQWQRSLQVVSGPQLDDQRVASDSVKLSVWSIGLSVVEGKVPPRPGL